MSIQSEKLQLSFLDHVIVIGGGRWARVFLEALSQILPSSVKITACSRRNKEGLASWASLNSLQNRIHFVSEYPLLTVSETTVVIIANAACDHENAIRWALLNRLPVLVEKPVTLSYESTNEIIKLAIKQNTYLAAAHVFLFANYIDNFYKILGGREYIQTIDVKWEDPQSEMRYGVFKSYDSGLPIFADWLPHITSILSLFSSEPFKLKDNLRVLKGGSHIKADILLGRIFCRIELIRNSDSRKRLIDVTIDSKKISLDFSEEPGFILCEDNMKNSDIDWNNDLKPVSKMLLTFLTTCNKSFPDKRLDIKLGLLANKLIDQVSSKYYDKLSSWLIKEWSESDDLEFRYAASEFLIAHNPNSSIPLDQRINFFKKSINGFLFLSSNLKNDKTPLEVVNKILKQGKKLSYS
ncbi:Gfo/Idh/MocA family oxidoreductase [Candidatus Methylopumilus planktonicus]|uniref:Gfo/Idh/MocA family oxidoreductase n=1 Tax=Candidatus Methylopumilus planktonicus TaxID=1581557 RepID=UPI003D18D5A5